MTKIIFYVVILLLLKYEIACAKKTTCDMPSVTLGETARLTCFFEEDMRKSQLDICVQRYAGESTKPEDVMDCYWSNESDSYKCAPSSPFVFSGNISNSLTLDLPSAQSSDEGTYYCEVVEDSFSYQFCNFTTLSVNSLQDYAQFGVSNDTTTDANFDGSIDTNTTAGTLRKDLKQTEKPESKSTDMGTIIGSSVAAVFVLVVVVCGILFLRKKMSSGNYDRKQIRYTPTNGQMDESKKHHDPRLGTQDVDSAHVNGIIVNSTE